MRVCNVGNKVKGQWCGQNLDQRSHYMLFISHITEKGISRAFQLCQFQFCNENKMLFVVSCQGWPICPKEAKLFKPLNTLTIWTWLNKDGIIFPLNKFRQSLWRWRWWKKGLLNSSSFKATYKHDIGNLEKHKWSLVNIKLTWCQVMIESIDIIMSVPGAIIVVQFSDIIP